MPYLEANGITIRYRISGNGPPLMILRGLVRSMDFWLDFEPILRRHFTVITMDNRGVGGSSKPLGPYSTTLMANDVAGLLRALDLGPVHLFGISLGGMIAQKVAILHPGLVNRLILGCTSPGPRYGVKPSRRRLLPLLKVPFQDPRVANRETLPLVLSQRYLDAHPEIEDVWWSLIEKWPVPTHVFLSQLAAALSHDGGRYLHSVHLETLLITGNADRLIPTENSEIMAEMLPNARLEWIPGSGHDFPTERPEETARLLREFLLHDSGCLT